MKKQLLGTLGAAVIAFASVPGAAAFEYENSETLQHTKSADGTYDCVVWRDSDKGDITFDGDKLDGGEFNCKWSDIESVSFSKGHILEEEKPYDEYGNIKCDYSIEYASESNSFYGIHGWVENKEKGYQQYKYAECFIIDGYVDYRPCSDKEPVGEVELDGCKYDIYRINNTAFDAPSFYQYWSVISEEDNIAANTMEYAVGHRISISDHFNAWSDAGIDMSGNLYEVSFDVEGWRCSGQANVLYNNIEVGEKPFKECDINGDNEFSVADIVTFQKWLLGTPDTPVADWRSGDLNGDGKLNVFDLCLMKRRYFSEAPYTIVEPDVKFNYGTAFFPLGNTLKMYSGPDESYKEVGEVPVDARLIEKGYMEDKSYWVYTEYSGQYGWIKVYDKENEKPLVFYEAVAAKPVIYLYPEEETDVHIELDLTESELSTTYPKYRNGWDVTAYPDGTLLNKADGTHHRYLFWDSTNCRTRFDLSKGFCVAGSDTESFLREKLTYMGLTEDEMNEFIVYWLPLMEHNPYNLITFQGEAYTDTAKLDITPSPDSICRIFMAYVPLDNEVNIEPQQLETFERNGFTVVEWGGCEIKQ